MNEFSIHKWEVMTHLKPIFHSYQYIELEYNLIDFLYEWNIDLNPFQPSVTFHLKTNHLFSSANRMTAFYRKCNATLG